MERDGVRIHYEVFGDGEPTIVLLPAWSIVHSRIWKNQVPYLARHFRVLTFDARGNGLSDRPESPDAYGSRITTEDALAVMDATGTDKAVFVSFPLSTACNIILGAEHADRVQGLVFIGVAAPWVPLPPERSRIPFEEELEVEDGWAKFNSFYWKKDYAGFVAFFMGEMFSEAHSTKQLDDSIGWGLETTPETLLAISHSAARLLPEAGLQLAAQIECPMLLIHGDNDHITVYANALAFADVTGAPLVTLEGSGHAPHARDPVKVNLLIRDFVRPQPSKGVNWIRGRNRRPRALYISSPIGLGHARRDVAIADELRKLRPDLEIDWLAQAPVTSVLAAKGERIHPASALLASEVAHIDSESSEHDLHCFQAWRNMDEILVANFMTFHDLVEQEDYDLWIGDEAWEIDYYLHENPELKRAANVWLTDFVGWLPMPSGGDREAYVAADYNAEMIEQIARYPRIRDRAIFVGEPDDIVPDSFGPDLPMIRDWTEKHFDFAGYITGFDAAEFADRQRIRAELGYKPNEKVCIVSVGGTGVGIHLLRRVIKSFAKAKRLVPELRMIVVAGPRIDPASLGAAKGLEVRGYVHDLYKHFAACDLAVVQGGLTTTMELTANKRPFLYFPLRNHFEQNFHVRHRLSRYGAGRCMDYETSTPDLIAEAIAVEISQTTRSFRDVASDGAARAAALIAELL